MIDVSLYIKKLSAVKRHIFDSIDGLDTGDLSQKLYTIEIDHEMRIINTTKSVYQSSEVIITEHAFERAKERLSMNRASFRKLSEKAYLGGVRHADTSGNLRKWINGIFLLHKTASNIRIYGENLFLFIGKTLVTVYQVPNNLRKSALKIQKIAA